MFARQGARRSVGIIPWCLLFRFCPQSTRADNSTPRLSAREHHSRGRWRDHRVLVHGDRGRRLLLQRRRRGVHGRGLGRRSNGGRRGRPRLAPSLWRPRIDWRLFRSSHLLNLVHHLSFGAMPITSSRNCFDATVSSRSSIELLQSFLDQISHQLPLLGHQTAGGQSAGDHSAPVAPCPDRRRRWRPRPRLRRPELRQRGQSWFRALIQLTQPRRHVFLPFGLDENGAAVRYVDVVDLLLLLLVSRPRRRRRGLRLARRHGAVLVPRHQEHVVVQHHLSLVQFQHQRNHRLEKISQGRASHLNQLLPFDFF